jgi:GTP1/Obg family GTP-binding protein
MVKSNANNFKFSRELKLKAKRANQRMKRLEKRGIKSPAYTAIQARLEIAGRRKGTASGRRFSETGKYLNKNDLKYQESLIDKFLAARTSTVKGYKEWQAKIYESANKEMNLASAGISQDQYFELWEALPDDERDRVYYAEYYINVMQAYEMKKQKGEIKNENAYSVQELVDIMDSAKSYKDALSKIGLTISDINDVKKGYKKK